MKKSTGDCKVSKSAQVPGLPFKDSFEPKPGYWGEAVKSNFYVQGRYIFYYEVQRSIYIYSHKEEKKYGEKEKRSQVKGGRISFFNSLVTHLLQGPTWVNPAIWSELFSGRR